MDKELFTLLSSFSLMLTDIRFSITASSTGSLSSQLISVKVVDTDSFSLWRNEVTDFESTESVIVL